VSIWGEENGRKAEIGWADGEAPDRCMGRWSRDRNQREKDKVVRMRQRDFSIQTEQVKEVMKIGNPDHGKFNDLID